MIVVESLIKSKNFHNVMYKYYYRLLESEVSTYADTGNFTVQSYGIEVERQDIVNRNVINIERNSIEKISPYRYKVHNLLKLLYDNLVSPIHLVDVLGDYVDEYTLDFDEAARTNSQKESLLVK